MSELWGVRVWCVSVRLTGGARVARRMGWWPHVVRACALGDQSCWATPAA